AFQERVFDKFFQVDGSQARRYSGAGIGLSIAKSLVEAHGGTIELESAIDKGSSFTLVFPDALFKQELTPEDRRGIAGLDVVLVAEDAGLREPVASLLSEAGCRVRQAGSGHECLREAKESRPDIILIDESLPDLSGTRTVSQLRRSAGGEAVPVALLTQNSRAEFADPDPAAGSIRVITKPFGPRELLGAIRELVFGEIVAESGEPVGPRERTIGPLARVILLSPDVDFAEWIETALRLRRVECVSGNSPAQARELAQGTTPDMILFDADGPEHVDAAALAWFKAEPTTRDIPVCAMTGAVPEKCISKGAVRTLRKPFAIEELTDIILAPDTGRGATTNH
ncbi:MAG TPA: response regulator, partial [Candidatus Hydrogenedentes bacterium]|nr:response regulator [Candidatus Hydrogenedentota bacterium]